MKITKLPDDMDPYKIAEKLAEEEGKRCPCCGEEKSFYTSLRGGIRELLCSDTKTIGLIHRREIAWKKFRCSTCGAEWQSEPYETDRKPNQIPWIMIIVSIIIYALMIFAVYKTKGEAVWEIGIIIWIPIAVIDSIIYINKSDFDA